MNRTCPRTLYGLLLIAASLLGSGFQTATLHAAEQEIDSIIAIVNDDIILASDFERERSTLMRQRARELPTGAELDKLVFERLIVQSLQLQQAKQRGIRIDDSNLQRTLEDMARNNNMSLAQMRTALNEDGIDYLEFRENIRKEMVISTLMRREVESNLRVSDEEVDNYLRNSGQRGGDQYQLDHILVKLPQQANEGLVAQALQTAQQLASRARDGESFAKLVEIYASSGAGVEGSNLGWRTTSDLPDLFAGEVAAMQVDDVSEPLRSPAGYHILKLADRRAEETRSVDRVRASHILVSTRSGRSVAAARQLAGGDLGWFGGGEMVPVFERRAFNDPVNQVSEPFQTQFGWHLMKVTAREYRDGPADNVADEARGKLRREKAEAQFQEWLQRLRDNAYVELRGFGRNFQ